jgi:prefoldin subunit 5
MQKQALKSQADLLQAELDQIRKRLEEIDATKGS